MNRDEALDLLHRELKNKNLVKHSLAVEACMRKFADHLSEDSDKWALAGLLHDLDYEYTSDDPDKHTIKTSEILAGYGIAEDILHAIQAHNMKVDLESPMDIALYSVDPATGFIIACALMHPTKKLHAIDLPRMKKRFKEKNFAKGASREQMETSRRLGISLDEFLQTCLSAMQEIHRDLGL